MVAEFYAALGLSLRAKCVRYASAAETLLVAKEQASIAYYAEKESNLGGRGHKRNAT